jgi:hypothetical protein
LPLAACKLDCPSDHPEAAEGAKTKSEQIEGKSDKAKNARIEPPNLKSQF